MHQGDLKEDVAAAVAVENASSRACGRPTAAKRPHGVYEVEEPLLNDLGTRMQDGTRCVAHGAVPATQE